MANINPHQSEYQLKYRPDIDGLRALAVLAVIGFHMAPNTIKGGFIGVDIFFVISGYLITGIILKSLHSNEFSLVDFYSRRVRRIFPALLLVLFSVYMFGWIVLLAQEFTQLSKHIVSGSMFVSNLVLWNESGYFDNFVDRKILLNLWSLGVEEQFYLFWPLILLLGFKLKTSIWKIIAFILIASFGLNIWVTGISPSAAFYSPFTRFWELLVGAGIGYIEYNQLRTLKIRSLVIANIFSITGSLLILLGLIFIDKQKAFPGWWAMLPTVGAGLIIFAGNSSFINKHILGAHISTSIGLISYPLYLWHWPLLVFGNIINVETPSYSIRFGLIALTFILSLATYWFIEKPIRQSLNQRKITISLVCLSVLMMLVSTVTFFNDGFVYREKNFSKISSAIDASLFPGNLVELKLNGRSYGNGYQNSKNEATTLFVGDSNIAHYYPRVNELLTKNSEEANSVIFLVQHGCLPIPNVFSDTHQCAVLESLDILKANQNIKTVVIGSRWFGQMNGGYYYLQGGKRYPIEKDSYGYKLALNSLKSFINDLKNQGKEVYLLLSSPIGNEFDPRLMTNRSLKDFPNVISVNAAAVSLEYLMDKYGFIRNDLKNMANALGIKSIDPIEYLCTDSICPVISSNGDPINSDPNHLNPFFVRANAKFIDQTVMPTK